MRTFFVIMESRKEVEELILISSEDGFYLRWFLWVRDEDLTKML